MRVLIYHAYIAGESKEILWRCCGRPWTLDVGLDADGSLLWLSMPFGSTSLFACLKLESHSLSHIFVNSLFHAALFNGQL